MHRIDTPSNANACPTPLTPGTPGYFKAPDPGQDNGTEVSPDWLNAVQEEISLVIEGLGGVLDKTSRNQLWIKFREHVGALYSGAATTGTGSARDTGRLSALMAVLGSSAANGLAVVMASMNGFARRSTPTNLPMVLAASLNAKLAQPGLAIGWSDTELTSEQKTDDLNHNLQVLLDPSTGDIKTRGGAKLAGNVDSDSDYKFVVDADGNVDAAGDIGADGNIGAGGQITATGDIVTLGNVSAAGGVAAGGQVSAVGDMTSDGSIKAGCTAGAAPKALFDGSNGNIGAMGGLNLGCTDAETGAGAKFQVEGSTGNLMSGLRLPAATAEAIYDEGFLPAVLHAVSGTVWRTASPIAAGSADTLLAMTNNKIGANSKLVWSIRCSDTTSRLVPGHCVLSVGGANFYVHNVSATERPSSEYYIDFLVINPV